MWNSALITINDIQHYKTNKKKKKVYERLHALKTYRLRRNISKELSLYGHHQNL